MKFISFLFTIYSNVNIHQKNNALFYDLCTIYTFYTFSSLLYFNFCDKITYKDAQKNRLFL